MVTADFLLCDILYILSATEAGKVAAAAAGRRHNWASRPLHFPCKSASHSQSFHSSSRKHALSQPHSLNTDETIARQLRPPTTMAGGRTSSARFADSCEVQPNPLRTRSPGCNFPTGARACTKSARLSTACTSLQVVPQ